MRPLTLFVAILLLFVVVVGANSIIPHQETPSFLSQLKRLGERIAHNALELIAPYNIALIGVAVVCTMFGIAARSSPLFLASQQEQSQIATQEAYATIAPTIHSSETLHFLPQGGLVVTAARHPNGTYVANSNAAIMVHNAASARYALRSRATRGAPREYYGNVISNRRSR